jgi:diadenosine tetraphosphatase ApaH/serine/threonine PP2A family protein phosphatase
MELTAFISDIHGNIDALEAVIADIKTTGATRIVCQGDVVGYGARPNECVALVEAECSLKILGNHDQAAVSGMTPSGWNPVATSAMKWTQRVLSAATRTAIKNYKKQDVMDEVLVVHGSPDDPTNEYVMARNWHYQRSTLLPLIPHQICVCGHSHTPGIFEDVGCGPAKYVPLDRSKYGVMILNVGSVGQPRDGDPRACYMLIDDKAFTWRRVTYDVDAAAKKIDHEGLDPFLSERLKVGR